MPVSDERYAQLYAHDFERQLAVEWHDEENRWLRVENRRLHEDNRRLCEELRAMATMLSAASMATG